MRARHAYVTVAALGWLVVAAVAVLELTAATLAVGAVASAATVGATLHHVLRPVVVAWQFGVEHGRRPAESDARRGLRVVGR